MSPTTSPLLPIPRWTDAVVAIEAPGEPQMAGAPARARRGTYTWRTGPAPVGQGGHGHRRSPIGDGVHFETITG